VGIGFHASKGLLVARQLDSALREHPPWPVTLHEVEVAPRAVLDEHPYYLKVREFVVVRDLPLSEAFGPQADEMVALFGQLRRSPWLAPNTAPDADRVAELIRRHYAALDVYAPVKALPCRIVTSWDDALRADNDVLHRASVTAPRDDAIGAAMAAVLESPAADEHGNAVCKAQIVPLHLAYRVFWDAAWEVASAELLAQAARTGAADPQTRVKAAGRIGADLAAARDRCRNAAWQAILALRTYEGDQKKPVQPTVQSLAAKSDDTLMPVWLTAWNFADAVASAVARAAKHMVAIPDEPNPWLPLVELFRMGAWPIDEVDGAFVVHFRVPVS